MKIKIPIDIEVSQEEIKAMVEAYLNPKPLREVRIADDPVNKAVFKVTSAMQCKFNSIAEKLMEDVIAKAVEVLDDVGKKEGKQ